MYCQRCDEPFSSPSNLRVHVKRKHPDELDTLAPKKNKQSCSSAVCFECNKKFLNLGNLRVHVKRQHPDKLEELAPVKKNNHTCPYCSENFHILKDLVLHKRSHRTPKQFNCPICQFTSLRENLIAHYKEDHLLQIENENLQFDTFEDFKLWKSKVEEETFSSFINAYGAKKKPNNCTIIVYHCHRSGHFKPKGMNIRKLKTQGSVKIGGYCPAKMNVRIKENKCYVLFTKSHVGHKEEQNLGHLFLSKCQRENIASKIAANIPFEVILDEMRDSETNCNLERTHLLTRKDLYNIEQCFKLKSRYVQQDPTELTSGTPASPTGDPIVNSDNETSRSVEALSTDNQTAIENQALLAAAKREFLRKLFNLIKYQVTSFAELDAVKRIVAPIRPTLDAIKTQTPHIPNLSPAFKALTNKRITSQRRLFSTKRINKRKKLNLTKPSAEHQANVEVIEIHITE